MAAGTIGPFGRDYLQLGLRIDKHQKGYKDYYYGPKEIKGKVNKESEISPIQLLKDCASLQKSVTDQGFDGKREEYLEKMLNAIEVTIERDVLGKRKGRSIEEDFSIQADMELRPFKESKLDDLKARTDEAYGGSGTLTERMEKMRKNRAIPEEEVKEAFEKGLKLTEQKTRELYPEMLPEESNIKVVVDSSIPWAAYEWYDGNYYSLVKINPKKLYWTSFLRASSHEGYPGHHTEFVVAEDKLYRKENRFEHAILLYNTPNMIMCEGIAGIGINTLFSYREQEEIALKEFCVERDKPSIEELLQQNMVRKDLYFIEFNAVYYKLVEGWEDKEVIQYIKDFEVYTDKSINDMMVRTDDPTYKMVGFAATLGKRLIIEALGEHPSAKNFRSLLENPVLPSNLI